MSDRADWEAMEKSMEIAKAIARGRRKQFGVDALIAVASFAGGCLGFGWAAKAYLGRIESDIERAAALLAAQAEQLKTLGDSNTKAHERIAASEKTLAVDEQAFRDLKDKVKDIELRSGALVRGSR